MNGGAAPDALSRRRAVPAAFDVPPPLSAFAAGCRYVDVRRPGIRRIAGAGGFQYVTPDGAAIDDAATLARIRCIAVPPAWRDVWIAPSADAHIQATGRDARGRKQYRYHPRFRAARDETKFQRALDFARALPRIRRRVDRDLAAPGIGRDKVLATIARLLEITLIRIGNEEYARANGSFGLTTLRNRHVDIDGSTIRFRFRGKSGQPRTVDVRDRRLARIVQRCGDLPGEELFQYLDESDGPRAIEAADVNEYLRRVSGQDFTAKDFRTWAGTVLAVRALRGRRGATVAERQRALKAAIDEVAARLGNTPAVCRKCYIHPAVAEAYLGGRLDAVARSLRRGTALSSLETDVRELLRKSIRRAKATRS